MTNEEVREVLQEQIDKYGQEYDDRGIEALKTAIKMLKQQPCEDCISRAKALEMLGDVPENWTDTEKEIQEVNDYRWFKSILEKLPSVTPQQRVGRWILEEVKDEDGRPYDIKYFCSECQAERPPIWDDYCGACGAKMEVEE
jgi:hypothetical protein